MKKEISKYMVVLIISIFISACGGENSNAYFKNSEKIDDVIACNANTASIPDNYTTMYSKDILVNKTSNTIVITYHDSNGIKKVCTETGTAQLIRKDIK